MITRKFENISENVPLLGFGCMRLPVKSSFADIDEEKAQEMVDYAMAHGVNYFDTAWMYHDGNSERFLAKALAKYPRGSYFLNSKMPTMFIKSEADVERIFNEQLKKCGVDYFDFYLLHNLGEDHLKIMRKHRVYEQVREKLETGQIRHFGFSFHGRPETLLEIVDNYEFEFAQIQLNYLDWDLQNASALYKILEDRKLPVIIMEPLRGGALARLCDESLRIFGEANTSVSAASWALRFAASLPGVMTVLSGMTELPQVKDNIATMENFRPLDDGERETIEKALDAYRKSLAIPCTACRYCMDCPQGVDIQRVFAVYNNYRAGIVNRRPMNDMLFRTENELIGEDHLASQCIACGQCVELCPQSIDIPHWMEVISAV
ncbi:MAG: aldo/keto reductase [Dysgonamonadaceae bacterium]|jgi:predicted aldo/keto reductase-like oxidoreductase|nr:aldo/keto reductase [Dysgonamonadaceae bacterium]